MQLSAQIVAVLKNVALRFPGQLGAEGRVHHCLTLAVPFR